MRKTLMLTKQEQDTVFNNAYIPEHLTDYVQAVSRAEPHIHEGYLCYSYDMVLIFIGYPLHARPWLPLDQDFLATLESACQRFRPRTINVIAPGFQPDGQTNLQPDDHYYQLDLPLATVGSEEAYMIRRAARELNVAEGVFSREHEALIEDFIRERDLGSAHREIFRRIPQYLNRSQSARLLEARKGSELVAFTILDLGSADYGFSLFNFRSLDIPVPGASDYLFQEMAKLAHLEGKRHLNLGLGVNPGIRQFKEKWGAVPFLPYRCFTIQKERRGLFDIMREMLAVHKTE